MAEQLPRPTDYKSQDADEVNRTVGHQGQGQNLNPYGTAAWNVKRGVRDVEANTSGRASRTPALDFGDPAPGKAAAPSTSEGDDQTLGGYGTQTAVKGQGGMTRV